MTPWRPGSVTCQWCLAIVLLGEETRELAHSTHVCGSPQQELCVDEAGPRPHILENLGPVVPEPEPFRPFRAPATIHAPATVHAPATIHAPVTVHVPVG